MPTKTSKSLPAGQRVKKKNGEIVQSENLAPAQSKVPIMTRPTETAAQKAAGIKNPSVVQTPQTQQQSSIEGMLRKKAAENIAVEQIKQNIIDEEIAKQQGAQVQQTPEQIKQDVQQINLPQQTQPTPQEVQNNATQNIDVRSPIQKSAQDFFSQVGEQALTQNPLQTTGQLIGVLKSFFGKPASQKDAEAALNNAMTSLEGDIALVATNQKSALEVKQSISAAEININNLQQSVRGLNKINAEYLRTNGLDIDTQIIQHQDAIKDFKLKLAVAEHQAIAGQLGLG